MKAETRYVKRTPHPAEITTAPGLAQGVNFSRALVQIHEPTLGCPAAVMINGRWFTPATGLDETLDKEWGNARP